LYASPDIIRVIKSRRMEWDGRGVYNAWERWEMHTKFWLENVKGGTRRKT
jgi:hypothetical protein